MNWIGRPVASSLHIAGIGASAGGLEAMLPLFAGLRPTGRVTYVVAQHMAKDGHDELVVRVIGRESTLPVVLAQGGEKLLADTIYVIPSGKDGIVSSDTLHLQPPAPTHLSTPSVNALFASIAASSRGKGIGIVLSGTGSDGVAGCRSIREQGGLTVAQSPAEAKFDGMPSAAIEAQTIDQILSVKQIGTVLAERFPGSVAAPSKPAVSGTAAPKQVAVEPAVVINPELVALLKLVHQATGIDFSSYKEDTLFRRLEKRISTLGLNDLNDYLALVRRDADELKTIQHLFLVSVSSFYRDRESFLELERALASTLDNKAAREPLRVWVPGCASGEEPYTLAMIFSELLAQKQSQRQVSIIGTDLNPEALELARAGVYRLTACKEMEPELRQRYLITHGQHVEVNAPLKAMVKFEQRDVLTGPPAELADGLDLVSCRNLLIYMKSPLQDQLITSFHRALRSKGLLFIGQSESLSFVGNSLFLPIDHYHRLFRRRH
jgi:chemotaxis methyl-accepting protein methylase